MKSISSTDRDLRFNAIAAEIMEPVRRYLLRRTDDATAEDLLSETLLAVWRRVDDVPGDGIAWSIGVARLLLRNADRATRRRYRLLHKIITVDPPPASIDPDQDDDRAGTADLVRRTLLTMRPGDAELIRLWAWDNLTPSEIAEVLGITTNAAGVRMHRARKRFEVAFRKNQVRLGHEQL